MATRKPRKGKDKKRPLPKRGQRVAKNKKTAKHRK